VHVLLGKVYYTRCRVVLPARSIFPGLCETVASRDYKSNAILRCTRAMFTRAVEIPLKHIADWLCSEIAVASPIVLVLYHLKNYKIHVIILLSCLIAVAQLETIFNNTLCLNFDIIVSYHVRIGINILWMFEVVMLDI
jgi:hypothetical protein